MPQLIPTQFEAEDTGRGSIEMPQIKFSPDISTMLLIDQTGKCIIYKVQ